jgi:hypothetical protein
MWMNILWPYFWMRTSKNSVQHSLGQWEPDTSLDKITQWFHEWLNDRIPLALSCSVNENDKKCRIVRNHRVRGIILT